ncbi:hypothetical protein [uncultured Cellulomonas sp.]|uniref:hypothetical protein n=1 Tax=uncultured Cellulomonas sp. TaxID=189682 RepID=UPI0028EF3A43|nr:hypothetical protein [uncultured Cellulomonas sp.]
MPGHRDTPLAEWFTSELAILEGRLREDLQGHATVQRQVLEGGRISAVDVAPNNQDSLHVSWIEMLDEVILEVGSAGRWELAETQDALTLIEKIIAAVVAGRVTETTSPGRSFVEVMLDDGATESSTRATARSGSTMRLPGAQKSESTIRYQPYH